MDEISIITGFIPLSSDRVQSIFATFSGDNARNMGAVPIVVFRPIKFAKNIASEVQMLKWRVFA
jgi:hypothetical protein